MHIITNLIYSCVTAVHYARANHESRMKGSEDDKLGGDHHYSVVGRQVEMTIKVHICMHWIGYS